MCDLRMDGGKFYNACMNDATKKLSLPRAMAVAAVTWMLLLGGMGLAALRVSGLHETESAGPTAVQLDGWQLLAPLAFNSVTPVRDSSLFRQAVTAKTAETVSDEPVAKLLLGQVLLKEPSELRNVFPAVVNSIVPLQFDGLNVETDQPQPLAQNLVTRPRDAGPIQLYIQRVVRRRDKPLLTEYFIGIAQESPKRYLVFAMRFDLPEELLDEATKQPLLQLPVLEHNRQVYLSIARTLTPKNSS